MTTKVVMKTNGTTATDRPESLIIIIEKGSLCVLKRQALGSIVI